MAQHFDLIVIGSGPGRRAAVQAAKLKKSVLVVERGPSVGGVCVHTGTRTTSRQRICAGVCTSHSITRSNCSNTS
jgi:pyruvate/2-oxoglutarate dehydrogenase complex dihydrolipoamide dehydrogenase (E3) component